MKESTAWLLTSAMEDVVNKGTGTVCRLSAIDMPIAGKTGSTSNYYDLWFSGYSPYYTASVWSGFDNNRSQVDKLFAKKIWKKIMEQIHIKKELEKLSFTKPDSVVSCKICTKSGKLAVDGLCDKYKGGNCTRVEYFAEGTEPTEYCDVHVKVKICKKSNKLATDSCPIVKELVLLNKTETGITADSPYLVPSDSCDIHKGGTSNLPQTDDTTTDDNQYPDPGSDIPDTDIPGTDVPGTDNPDVNTPGTDLPGTDNPSDDNLGDALQNIISPNDY
jgi:penicillin-binding protein 1A